MSDKFEELFQKWLEGGGLAQPALREDLEREQRMEKSVLKKAKDTCPHGQSPLTCSTCYFNGPGYLHEDE